MFKKSSSKDPNYNTIKDMIAYLGQSKVKHFKCSDFEVEFTEPQSDMMSLPLDHLGSQQEPSGHTKQDEQDERIKQLLWSA